MEWRRCQGAPRHLVLLGHVEDAVAESKSYRGRALSNAHLTPKILYPEDSLVRPKTTRKRTARLRFLRLIEFTNDRM